jgi:cytosine deaminase
LSDLARIGPVALIGQAGTFQLSVESGRIASIDRVVETPIGLALPAFADLHLHADRAFAPGQRVPRSLADAADLVRAVKRGSSENDVRLRATRLLERALEHGTLRARTHVDVDELVDERSLRGVLVARETFAGTVDLELVAFASRLTDPTTVEGEARLRAAAESGADLLGAAPAFHAVPVASAERLLALVAELGLAADLHVDESSEPEPFLLEALADATRAHGLEGRVTASHACALSSVDDATARRTIAKLAEAQITVVVLPALNLFLQGRGERTPRVRGLTLVRELLAAGVEVRFASDNVRDVFYPYGDADPLEAAWLAAVAAHVDDEDALLAGICAGRTRIEVGDPADLVLVEASSFRDALARRPGGRTVVRAGRVVSGPMALG